MGLERTDFDSLVKSLNPAVYMPLGFGDVLRRDAVGGHATVVGTPKWRGLEVGPGYAFDPAANGRLEIAAANCSATDVDAWTVFTAGMFRPVTVTGVNSRLLSKRTVVGGISWELILQINAGADRLTVLDSGGSSRWLVYSVAGDRTIAARAQNGQLVDFFANGAIVGQSALAAVLDTSSNNFYVANRYDGIYPIVAGGSSLALFFPSLLEDEAIYDLDRLWNAIQGVSQRILWQVYEEPEDDLLGSNVYLSGKRAHDGTVIDLTGRGNNATPSNVVTFEKGTRVGFRTFGQGDGRLVIASPNADIDDIEQVTYIFHLRADTTGEGAAGDLLDKGALELNINAATILYQVPYTDGNAQWSFPLPTLGLSHTIVLRHDQSDPANLPVVEVDGEDVTVTVVQARAGARVSDVGSSLYLHDNAGSTASWDGITWEFKLVPRVITDAESRQVYVDVAKHSLELCDRYARPETLGASGTRAGPLEVGAGAFEWLDDGEKRRLVCATAGWAVVPSRQAYGAWYLRALKQDANGMLLLFATSSREAANGATQTGYELTLAKNESVQLRRRNNGIAVTTIVNSGIGYIDPAVEYEYFISRRPSDDRFFLWIRGGDFVNWNPVGDASNIIINSSVFFIVDIDSGDEVSDVLFFPEGYTLLPTDVL